MEPRFIYVQPTPKGTSVGDNRCRGGGPCGHRREIYCGWTQIPQRELPASNGITATGFGDPTQISLSTMRPSGSTHRGGNRTKPPQSRYRTPTPRGGSRASIEPKRFAEFRRPGGFPSRSIPSGGTRGGRACRPILGGGKVAAGAEGGLRVWGGVAEMWGEAQITNVGACGDTEPIHTPPDKKRVGGGRG